MGALARPGPQLGIKGPPEEAPHQLFGAWFWTFLRDELRPYPGRTRLVLRMLLAATLTMLCIMTFRLPGAAIAAYYTLLLSRDTPLTTARAALTVLVCYAIGASYALIGVLLFVDYPLTHFLWIVVSVFLCFYVVRVATNYVAAAALAFIITIVIPLWDTSLPTAALVGASLWAAGSVGVGLFCTLAVEYLFSLFQETQDELQAGLALRLTAASEYLRNLAGQSESTGDGPRADAASRVQQLAMVGVSRLRSLASSPDLNERSPERRSTMVSLVGRVVDLTAALPELLRRSDLPEAERLHQLADQLDELQQHLGSPIAGARMPEMPAAAEEALVTELERTVALLRLSLSSEAAEDVLPLEQAGEPAQSSFFLPDAFTNPDYLMFSLRGCLAAMLCYVVYNGIFWRGLSTSLATCIITALTSIGSSRQKQILRLSGALVGGLLGIGSQVLVLPMLDSIAGFTVLFVVVTAVAAWVGTSSPRLSYGGQQIALAFFLIHLQEPLPQTNLAIARDRVMGVGLGLVMMWLVFDTLGSRPATQVMRDLFATNLRLLAQLAEPWRDRGPADLRTLRGLRDKLSQNFGTVNAQADAVLFEVGPSRARDLAVRDRLLAWQPRLRSLLLIEVGLLQYRGEVRPEEVAPEIVQAQKALDRRAVAVLDAMADGFAKGEPPPPQPSVSETYDALQAAVQQVYAGQPTSRAQGVLALSSHLAETLDGLSSDLARPL